LRLKLAVSLLKEEERFRDENSRLRGTFLPKTEEIREGWGTA
jgi:hypothetical protein